MQIVVYFNSLFPDATEMVKGLVVDKMRKKAEQGGNATGDGTRGQR